MSDTVKIPVDKFALPERVQADTTPENYVKLEDLCNGDDLVIRGTGKQFRMAFGLVTPVLFSHTADWRRLGPDAAVWQFVTSSEAILRHVRGTQTRPIVGRIEYRVSERDPERSYYVIV